MYVCVCMYVCICRYACWCLWILWLRVDDVYGFLWLRASVGLYEIMNVQMRAHCRERYPPSLWCFERNWWWRQQGEVGWLLSLFTVEWPSASLPKPLDPAPPPTKDTMNHLTNIYFRVALTNSVQHDSSNCCWTDDSNGQTWIHMPECTYVTCTSGLRLNMTVS